MRMAAVAVAAVLAAGLSGCGAKHSFAGKRSPKWIDRGSGAFKEKDGGRVLYGVGVVRGVENPGLARQSVDNRALADLGKTVSVFSSSVMKDFSSSIGSAKAGSAEEEQLIESNVKTFSEVSMTGAKVVEHWTDHETNTYYALARLDMEEFKRLLDSSNKLTEQVRAHIRDRAEKAFDAEAKPAGE